MNDHLKAAIDFSQTAANCFYRAGGDVSDRFAEQLRRDGHENIHLALAAAAIAQAEAAKRQALAMERIVALFGSVITPLTNGAMVVNTYDAYHDYQDAR